MGQEGKEIKVESYSGYRAPETPRKVYMNGKRLDVGNVLKSWRTQRFEDGEIEEHFAVDLPGYGECEIIYNPQMDRWTLKDSAKGRE